MLQTLVLNTSSIPISIVPFRNVIGRIWANSAIVLENYEGTCIRSAGCTSLNPNKIRPIIEMPIPSVVQCIRTNYIPKFTNILPFNRMNVYLRDAGHCQYCGRKVSLSGMSFDHVIPRIQGGKTNWLNIVIACHGCNSKKGARHPSKFKWPIRMPYAPKLDKAAPIHLVNKIAVEIPVKSWTDYIYWKIQLLE